MTEKKPILICTVGGSHEPIVRSIDALQPDFVCFVCSQDDQTTGSKGSYTMINGKGLCIKRRPDDEKPTLPNIPGQTGLAQEQYEILLVDPDDLDGVCSSVQKWLVQRDHQQDRIVADYSGGTKTMSAGLVVALLEDEHAELRLVTGARSNLEKIASSDGYATPASVGRVRLNLRIREAGLLWSNHAYSEAAKLLQNLPTPRETDLRNELQRARDLSLAFAAWDRFDHSQAFALLERYRPLLGERHPEWYNVLKKLTEAGADREPLRLFDLYLNARRRAASERFDDAIARLYRLLEWSAQWLLKEKVSGLDTSNLPEDSIPAGLEIPLNREGKRQAGLFQAWELLSKLGPTPIAKFWDQERETLLDLLKLRNHSILAHGFLPLQSPGWERLESWTEAKLLPLLLEITGKPPYRIRQLPEQLPAQFPD